MTTDRLICPYCDRNDPDLEWSREHIVPHFLGGGLDFAVEAHAECNSRLGGEVEGPLSESFLFAAMCSQYGVKSRSGVPSVEFPGTLKNTNDPIIGVWDNTEFTYHAKPVVEKISDREFTVHVMADDAEAFLKRFEEPFRKKGLTPHIVSRKVNTIEDPLIEVRYEIDLLQVGKLLTKIIHSAALRTFGPHYFWNNPVAHTLRSALHVKSWEELQALKIHGRSFSGLGGLEHILPPVQEHEHTVSIFCQDGVTIGLVSLFGHGGFFTSLIPLSEKGWCYPANGVFEGIAYIIDPQTRKTRVIDLVERLLELGAKYPDGELPPEFLGEEP